MITLKQTVFANDDKDVAFSGQIPIIRNQRD